MPKLTIQEVGAQSVYELFEDQHEVLLGRGASNAVQVHDSHASKHHASLRRIGDRWKFVDLESKNGTRVNGAFCNQHWLANGDMIAIGDAVIGYADAAVAAGAAVPTVSAPSRVPAPPAPAYAVPAPALPPSGVPAPAPSSGPSTAPARSGSVSTRGASRRRERDDHDDYDDEERRPTRRRDDKGGLIALLAVIGAGIFVMLMIKLLQPTEYINQTVRVHAAELANLGDPEAAIAYAERYGDPEAVYWYDLKREMDNWREQIEMRPMIARNAEAGTWFENNVVRRTRTSTFRAKDALSEEEAAGVLREFLTIYGDTGKAKELLYSKAPPYPEYREMMRAYASDEADPGKILAQVRNAVESLTLRRHFGEAVGRLEDLKATQQVLLSRDRAEEVRRLVDQEIARVRRDARSAFESDIRKVDRLVDDDNMASARALLEDMIDIYGIDTLVNEARLKLDDL